MLVKELINELQKLNKLYLSVRIWDSEMQCYREPCIDQDTEEVTDEGIETEEIVTL
jgi:hypothetical protein